MQTDPSAEELLARYDQAFRAHPKPVPGLSADTRDGVMILVGYFNFVSHWTIPPDEAADTVANVARRVRARGGDLQWCVYDHDGPANLSGHLTNQGFVVEETTTLMTLENGAASRPARSDVRRVADAAGLRDYLQVVAEAFGVADTWQADAFSRRLDDPDLALLTAYVQDRPVAAGRLEIAHRSGLGCLFGGGVAPPWRGRGLYTDLVAARALHARENGVTHLMICARETSRPILERVGFRAIGGRTCWWLRHRVADHRRAS